MADYGWKFIITLVFTLALGITLGYFFAVRSLSPGDVGGYVVKQNKGQRTVKAARRHRGFLLISGVIPVYSDASGKSGDRAVLKESYLKPGSRIEIEVPGKQSPALKAGSSYMAVLRLMPALGPLPKAVCI